MTIDQIHAIHGPNGVSDYVEFGDGRGCFTDDTQMTLFTAEGMLRAEHRSLRRGIRGAHGTITHHAYLRWLSTQQEVTPETAGEDIFNSWLLNIPGLKTLRSPGTTCINALSSGICGTIETPINNSKGCGGIMRMAPVGLMRYSEPDYAFKVGGDLAAITHGHPTGYLSAGTFAAIIAFLVQGYSLLEAIEFTTPFLMKMNDHEETMIAIDKALKLSASGRPSSQKVERLGGGWIAEEALAIALYCSLVHEANFTEGIILSVNHSGDSDSTGALTGNLLGLISGEQAIPNKWKTNLQMSELIQEVATDIFIQYKGNSFEPDQDWLRKYPPF